MYLLAIVLPPLAVLLCGKPFQAILNCGLTVLGWVPGMIHALFVVAGRHADRRTDRVIESLERQQQLQALQLRQEQLARERERLERQQP